MNSVVLHFVSILLVGIEGEKVTFLQVVFDETHSIKYPMFIPYPFDPNEKGRMGRCLGGKEETKTKMDRLVCHCFTGILARI